MHGLLLLAFAASAARAQVGGYVEKEIPLAPRHGDPIVREDFDRCEPAGAVVVNEREPDKWVLRTEDWPSPLLNAVGDPPPITYDPGLTGVYDIYVGSRATDFPVCMAMKLAGEEDFTVITSPRGTRTVHSDWEFCFRREVPLDGEKIVIESLGAAVYLDYLKFVPVVGGTVRARVATDHVTIGSEEGRHFAFPGVARLADGSLAVVARAGTAHIDPSGSVAMWRSTDGGRTWGPRETIYDDPDTDERDPAICLHSSGTLLVSMHSKGARVMRSTDGGSTWDEPTLAPGFSPHGPSELPDGRIYWCGITTKMGINHVEIATSEDLGRTWQITSTVAMSLPYHQPWVRPFWDEPWAMPLGDDRWLAMHRVDMDGYLYQNHSSDGGQGFDLPRRTPLWGCPPFVLKLRDGRLLALYGHRRVPWGIRACVGEDGGRTWDIDNEIVLRDDGGHGDLGYAVGLEIEPGLVFAVYYHNSGGKECTIEGTFFRP